MHEKKIVVICCFLLLLLSSCRYQENRNNEVILHIDLGVDLPLQVSLTKMSDYTSIFDSTFHHQDFSFKLDSVAPAVYLLEMRWEPQNLSREEMRMMLKGELDEALMNEWQKIIYLDPKQDSVYKLRMNNKVSPDELEVFVRKRDPRYSLILETVSKDARLLEAFEGIERNFRIDYHNKMDSLYVIRYNVDVDRLSDDNNIEEQQTELLEIGRYKQRKIEATRDLMLKNIDSPIVPYILYSYGYSLRKIEEFKPVISKLDKFHERMEYGMLLKNVLQGN